MDINKWTNKLAEGAITSLVASMISVLVTYCTFKANLDTTKNIESVRLARELTRDFYASDPDFRDIRMAIESCEKLYKSWGGRFTHDQINRYLGFFDDIGFYVKEGILDIRFIDHLYGAYIIEAYEYNELRKYVDLLQKHMKQKEALMDLQELAKKLEEIPERKEMIELARRGCSDKL